MGYRAPSVVSALLCILAGCGGSGGGGGVIPDPALMIDGEYQIAVDTVVDRCGFGTGSSSTPISVFETGESSANVNIPLGGAGGQCSDGPFQRMDNLLSRSFVTQQSVGSCVVDTLETTTLEFFADGSVVGSESVTLMPVSGDCSSFGGECTSEVSLTGDLCSGCFSCLRPTAATASDAGIGFLQFELSAVAPLATPK